MWVVLLLLFRWLLVPLCRSPSRKHKEATPSITPGCSLPGATPKHIRFCPKQCLRQGVRVPLEPDFGLTLKVVKGMRGVSEEVGTVWI